MRMACAYQSISIAAFAGTLSYTQHHVCLKEKRRKKRRDDGYFELIFISSNYPRNNNNSTFISFDMLQYKFFAPHCHKMPFFGPPHVIIFFSSIFHKILIDFLFYFSLEFFIKYLNMYLLCLAGMSSLFFSLS